MRILSGRFDELAEQLKHLESTQTKRYSEYSGNYRHIEQDLMLNWSVKVRNLLSKACGKDSEHYVSFCLAEEPQSYEDNVDRLNRMKAVFLAAQEDFNGGFLNSVHNLIQAELADDELDQARVLIDAGYIAAAAVVAGVVLETTLRTLSIRRGIPIGSIDKMNADLAKAGQYNTLVQKRVTALAAVRNSAAHGKSQEYSVEDVAAFITEVERFVEVQLS
ncbi:hypothetical protein HFRIS_001679 [Herbaspirillum frisingense GSF30]|uniref:DUF4145 domain-containing protein n=1 Tax=Herbaspirillum frisingense GSF30 TaxID=864073 RepID=A0AAI9N5I8_9BURK|nr:hypothetical protein [Herbaspirillum frisingense]EOA06429.1 hypothetical protein HFRIS_001679 [Herbaspirillum frisingense GSF30]